MTQRATGRPTIKTICALTGLSTATVSKALRHSPQVRPETRQLVEDAARRLGYATNMHGVQLRTGKTYQIATIMTAPSAEADEWEGVEYAQLLSGISHAMEQSRYRVALYPVADYAEAQDTVARIVTNRLADGVVLAGTRPDDARVRILQDAGLPFVTYGTTALNGDHPFVDADNAAIINGSLGRLIGAGHRRIALLNPPAHLSYGAVRLATYRAALHDHGLPFDPALIAHDRLTPGYGRAQVIAMAALARPPTAYVCANEAVALGALSGFAAAGLVHGRDAVIHATDDLNISAYLSPPLTTYYLPISRPAGLLGDHILRAIAGEPVKTLQTFLMPELIVRSHDRLER
jgi:LacI family transcriptional regulator